MGFRLCALLTVLSTGCAPARGPGALDRPPREDVGAKADDHDDDGESDETGAEADVLSTDLQLDLQRRQARADVVVDPGEQAELSLSVGDLEFEHIGADGAPLDHHRDGETLHVQLGDRTAPLTLRFDYRFHEHGMQNGYMPDAGVTLLWPYFCGNLFPCRPDPRDGMTFEMRVDGVPEGEVAVHPDRIAAEGPAYMPAFAVGEYHHQQLGHTDAGTTVGVWYLDGHRQDAIEGTEDLVAVFDFFETTYGDYSFGDEVGSVEAPWGGGAYGGMEHHPLWHVSTRAMDDAVVQAHEAAHGWYGNGVRIRCWEDFALSEGVASYMAARAMTEVGGPEMQEKVWRDYRLRLQQAVEYDDTIARPDGCNEIDILEHPLWSSVPYMKGAFFLKRVAEHVGVDALDEALALFYREHVGGAAGVRDLLDAIEAHTGFDPTELAEHWLYTLGTP